MSVNILFVTAFLVGLSGAMMPGPLLTVTIAESVRRGFIAGPLIILGHAVLELALILALIAGLSVFLSNITVSSTIALLGGIVLIYLGLTMSRDALRGNISLGDINKNEVGTTKKGLHPVLAGAVISLANPFWSIWWATVGLTYLTMSLESGRIGLASFFSGHILADLVWYTLVAAVVAGGKKFISPPVYKYIIVVCGIFLLVLGLYFIYSFGVRQLMFS